MPFFQLGVSSGELCICCWPTPPTFFSLSLLLCASSVTPTGPINYKKLVLHLMLSLLLLNSSSWLFLKRRQKELQLENLLFQGKLANVKQTKSWISPASLAFNPSEAQAPRVICI